MITLPIVLLLTNAVVFIFVSLTIILRVREAEGALKPAKTSIASATTFAAIAFIMEAITALSSSDEPLAKQLYVLDNLFTMLAVASLSSFTLFATYVGSNRNLLAALFYTMAIVPPTYLAFTYDRLQFQFMESGLYQVYIPNPGLALFIIFGAPLGVLPFLMLAKSLVTARKRRDKASTRRAALVLSTITSNLLLLIIYVFGDANWGMVALIAWIPAVLLLLFSFLRTARPIGPQSNR
jgi:hypothetical protein